ncbi:MAG: MGMT family protein [Pseudomonadales bacterium]
MPDTSRQEAVWLVVAAIPAGTVATYGQIARLAQLPGQARWVGRVLSQLPSDSQLPWHRVINASGKISLAEASDAYRLQRQRLEAEGICFHNDRIKLSLYQWR